jgi:hypothetical protein
MSKPRFFKVLSWRYVISELLRWISRFQIAGSIAPVHSHWPASTHCGHLQISACQWTMTWSCYEAFSAQNHCIVHLHISPPKLIKRFWFNLVLQTQASHHSEPGSGKRFKVNAPPHPHPYSTTVCSWQFVALYRTVVNPNTVMFLNA